MRIFLGAPFTNYLDKERGEVVPKQKALIEKAVSILSKKGHHVINAHIREDFGKKLMTPEVCTKFDLVEIKKCDMFIAIPGNPPSGGVHVELGWASALNKKIVLILREGGRYSPLIKGLPAIGEVNVITYRNEQELFEKLDREI